MLKGLRIGHSISTDLEKSYIFGHYLLFLVVVSVFISLLIVSYLTIVGFVMTHKPELAINITACMLRSLLSNLLSNLACFFLTKFIKCATQAENLSLEDYLCR